MKTIGSLANLRLHCIKNMCIITGKHSDLSPAIVRIKMDDGREMRKDGMVHKSIRSGKRINGGKITSVVRKNVEMVVESTKNGITYADCKVA